MKKVIVLFVSIMIMVLGLSFSGLNAFAHELEDQTSDKTPKYKVGDKMPDYKLGTFLEGERLATEYVTFSNCQIFYQLFSLKNSDSNSMEYLVAFPSTKAEMLPYEILYAPTMTVFLDNRNATTGKNGPDGLIDEIFVNVDSTWNTMDDHPYCYK